MASRLYPQVVLLGDSLIQHSAGIKEGFSFQAELQTKFIRRLDVVNRGFSGFNSSNVLTYLPELFTPPSESTPRIEYLVVLLGANDAVKPIFKQHVPKETYKENLVSIITHPIIKANNPKIILVTPPPVNEIRLETCDAEKGWPEITRHASISAEYTQVVRDLGAERPDVTVVDLWRALMDYAVAHTPGFTSAPEGTWLGTPACGMQGKLEDLLPDGLHLSGEAYRVFYEALLPHIGAEWANLPEEDRTGYLVPDWRTFALD